MLQQQEATPIVVFVRSVTTEQRWKNRLWKPWGEKLSVTHLLVESRSNVKGSGEGKEKESGLGRDRRKSQRGAEGVREDGDKMQCLCARLWRSQQIHFTGVSPAFLPEPQRSQPSSHGVHNVTRSWIFLQPERANYWGSRRGMQGWVCGFEQEGSCATSHHKFYLKIKPCYWDTTEASDVQMQPCVWLSSSAVPSKFSPFGWTDNISHMKLY